MNPVLQFPKRGRAMRRSEIRRGPPAQILFFTGVRYERHLSAQMVGEDSVSLVADAAVSARRLRTRRKKSA